jgi:hypothetical protein
LQALADLDITAVKRLEHINEFESGGLLCRTQKRYL